MLPTNRRVKKDLFPEIMKNGSFFHGKNCYLRVLVKKDVQNSRFSVVVPAKIEKTSVGRHLTKRKISAVIEKNIGDILPGKLAILFVKAKMSHLSPLLLESELIDLLKKAQLLKV